ncbi:MAG: hypothetical protein ACYTEZ_15065 [Planctomycetota bacterium]|jgi:hypothetical protein
MRTFLPIKGPGGRYLTPNEKIALLVLGLTLVLCVLTVLAGESAYLDSPARNPVFGFVALLGRAFGGGIVALYGFVLIWSGLVYFKGERIADVAPLGGRLFAVLAITVGVSGALGIAHMESAGSLGLLVGSALDNTLGGAVGFPILLMLMLLGFHLAGQGAWTALREPMALATATGSAAAPLATGSLGLPDAAGDRFSQEPPLPDDGDPSPDERSLAVTQAMEEIERSQGVTIVDVEADAARPSLGEEVEAAPPPPPETEEAEVREGLREVASVLEEPADDATPEEEGAYPALAHGLVPVPPAEELADDEEDEEAHDDEDEEEEADDEGYVDEEEEDAYEEEAEDEEDGEAYEDEEDGDEEDEEAHDDEEDGDEEDEEAHDDEEDGDEDEEEDASYEEEDETAVESNEEESAAQADGFGEADPADPYARGGLLRRTLRPRTTPEEGADEERPYTTFDWRGRPLD